MRAPFWLAVSVLVLLCGLLVVDAGEAKGRAALIAVGAFGVLISLAVITYGRIRAGRDP